MIDLERECTDPTNRDYDALICHRYRASLDMFNLQRAIADALYLPQIVRAISRGLTRLGTWILPK